MIEILLILGLNGMNVSNGQLSQISTCQWPNKCEAEPVVAQISTCQWPNKCEVQPVVAQISTCQWPNKCSADPAGAA